MINLVSAFALVTSLFGLPPGLLSAMCYVETKHDVASVHEDDGPSHSYGVCQVKLETAQYLGFHGSAEQLQEPLVNIFYAGKYLDYQLHRYKGSVKKAVSAYNAGRYRDSNHPYVNQVFLAWSEDK